MRRGAPRSIRVKPVVQATSVGKPKKPDVRVDALVGRAANKFRKRRNRNFQRPRKPMPAGLLWGNFAYSLHGRVFAASSFPIEALNPLLGAPPGIRDYCTPAGKRCELQLRNISQSFFFSPGRCRRESIEDVTPLKFPARRQLIWFLFFSHPFICGRIPICLRANVKGPRSPCESQMARC